MNADAQLHWRENFDEPWRRLPWVILAALIAWIVLLAGFARMLEQQPVPQPPPTTIEARIVELPPPAAGLQGGGAPAGGAAVPHLAPVAKPKPQPLLKPKPVVHHVRKARVKPPPAFVEPPSPFGTAKHVERPAPEGPPVASRGPTGGAIERHGGAEEGAGGIGGGTDSGSGAGLGSDSSGARAMYAPAPTIPDDMRETTFSTVAVARFKVSPEGTVDVALIKPTPNPRLNQILLDTLKQWKFFPAMKDGVAINSEFEVRIPIAVQ
ncbi:MAG TPA: TonB family protein [Candidatus Binataceae bacterium]|jgi:protein TonB|nr:TonB family protein [Candidatus Binataceae bacterium]